MLVVETLAAALAASLLVIVTALLWIGSLGVIGTVQFVRCDRCNRLGLTSTSNSVRPCWRCRHGRLMHPILAIEQVRPIHHARSTTHRVG